MGKAVKKNRKMKRTIRRTIGALCMISAITIAAIPASENRAYDPAVVTNVPEYSVTSSDYLEMKTTDSGSGVVKTSDDYTSASPGAGDKSCRAYYMYQDSKSNWTLDWQYTYFKPKGYAKGFLAKCNSANLLNTLEITGSVYIDYVNVLESEYLNWRNSSEKTYPVTYYFGETAQPKKTINTLGYLYQLSEDYTSWVKTGEDYKALTEILGVDALNKYENDYFEYQQWLPWKAWVDAHGNDDEYTGGNKFDIGTVIQKPTAPAGRYSDIYDDPSKLAFFTNQIFGDTAGVDFVLSRKYTYTGDELDSDLTPIYVAHAPIDKGHVETGVGNFYADTSGFLCSDTDVIGYIGANAFKGVQKTYNLIVAPEITMFGDSAFEGSNIKSIEMSNGTSIGNRAFAECKQIEHVTIPSGTNMIGCEAFALCDALQDVIISKDVVEIGPGAFTNCGSLSRITIEPSSTGSHTIDKFAFYNCNNLNTLDFDNANITSIDDAAFALADIDNGNLKNFKFPDSIGSVKTDNNDNDGAISSGVRHEGIGDYVLAGRSGLSGDVTMPKNIGSKKLPDTMVFKCTNLGSVVFPEDSSRVSYDPTMFYSVYNDNFYVRGPKLTDDGKDAIPRTSTWKAEFKYNDTTQEGSPVPYVYNEGTGDIYEISDGTYILSIDESGMLLSCLFADSAKEIPELTIPEHVGNITVSGIKDGCFNNTTNPKCVLNYIKKFVVEDGSNISSIDANSFYSEKDKSGAKILEEVDLGNSITSIGSNAFLKCPELKSVTIGENIKNIGESAFEKCNKLTDIYFNTPYQADINSGNYLKESGIGQNAMTTGSPKLTVHGTIIPDYGPFVWSMGVDNFVDSSSGLRVCYNSPAPDNLTVILDNTTLYPTLVDYPHYEYLSDTIRNKIETGETLEPDEQYAYNCITDIVIPAGIKSIDVKEFINAKADPSKGNGLNNARSADVYMKNNPDFRYYEQYKNYGLFNGYYGDNLASADGGASGDLAYEYKKDESDRSAYEKNNLGNDRIVAVYMEDVAYLPDKAFNNCEKLNMVGLGDDITNVGELPFYNCTNLASVGCGNDKYLCEYGILYENLAGNKKKIVECLASRGESYNPSAVDTGNDPLLTSVIEIAPHAFDDCDGVRFVDFTGADDISTIPEGCFANCDNLRTVELPTTVDQVDKDAFSNNKSDVEIVARNRQIFLSSGAIDKDGGNTPYFVTYKDSQSRKYAKEQGANIDKTLDEYYTVKFYSYDGKILLGTDFVQEGKTAIPPEDSVIPDRSAEGLVFDKWSIDLRNITDDCFALAMYRPISAVTPTPGVTPGITPGVTPGRVTPGVTPKTTPNVTPSPTGSATKYTLTVVYGSGSGQYPANTKVIIEAISAPEGKEFDKWVVTGAGATVYSSTSKATTITTAAGDSNVTATYKDISKSSTSNNSSTNGSTGTYSRTGNGSSGVSGNGGTSTGSNTNVNITKPGISDVDKAYASVNGSTDNFLVKVTEDSNAANQIATALANKYPDMSTIKYFPMDISLYDATGSNKISNDANLSVNVTMPIPDALRQYGGNCKVASVINGNQLEDLPCKFVTVSGVPCVSFTATHFSPYTIYVDTNNLVYGLADGSPKTGDPIHPKWFVVIALAATSLFLFLKKDRVRIPRTV